MAKPFTGRRRLCRYFGRIAEVAPMPNLIEVQKISYDKFLQMHTAPGEREPHGLQAVLRSVFPISDFSGRAQLEYVESLQETSVLDRAA